MSVVKVRGEQSERLLLFFIFFVPFLICGNDWVELKDLSHLFSINKSAFL